MDNPIALGLLAVVYTAAVFSLGYSIAANDRRRR
jgi:hypothetical protein